jgi:hypothetical protein
MISETHSHVRELIIHGKTFTGYSAVEQIVTFCPDQNNNNKAHY